MAGKRRDASRIVFDFSIKNVKDVEKLKEILPSLVRDYEKLAIAMDKVEKRSAVPKGGATEKSKVRDDIAGLQLKVNTGAIQSIKQLTSNYDKLISRIQKLKAEGEKTNALELRAITTKKSLVAEIKKRISAEKELEASSKRAEAAAIKSAQVAKKSKIGDRITGLQVKSNKGEIQTVRQLTANYANLIGQIKRLQAEGQNTNALELRAMSVYKSVRTEIEKRVQAQEQLEASLQKTEAQAMQTAQKTQEVYAGMSQAGGLMKQTGQDAIEAAGLTKQAGYLFLNTGYLIQDSPYGIRGIANNISATTQAYHYSTLR